MRVFADRQDQAADPRRRSPKALAESGLRGGGGALPHAGQIQRSFGRHDVRGATAFMGSRAAAVARALDADAYTIGERVGFARPPDLQTAAHEAAHVVQQRQGVRISGEVSAAGDAYERQADSVAAAVARGESAEALLDAAAASQAGWKQTAIQRKVPTDWGDFATTKYSDVGPAGKEYGVDIELTFDPDAKKVDATRIGLTQAVRSQLGGRVVAIHPSMHTRMVPSGKAAGWQIDRTLMGAYANPLYGTAVPGAKDKLGDTPMMKGSGQFGFNYTDKAGKHHDSAKLVDTPTRPGRDKNASQIFETAALAVAGTQSGTYMGSVTWGWTSDAAGKFNRQPLKLASKGKPSAEFAAAAKQWNKWVTAGTIKTKDKTNVYDAAYSVAFTVAKDTEVTVTGGAFINADVAYSPVTIKSGAATGKTGRMKVDDLKDVGGGRKTIPLPLP